jgi:hypothetical protein
MGLNQPKSPIMPISLMLPRLSHAIGTKMSGNSNILAFGYNTDYEVNLMARTHPESATPVSPTITGVIDCRDQGNPLEGFIIEEGAVPEALLEGMPGKKFPRQSGT